MTQTPESPRRAWLDRIRKTSSSRSVPPKTEEAPIVDGVGYTLAQQALHPLHDATARPAQLVDAFNQLFEVREIDVGSKGIDELHAAFKFRLKGFPDEGPYPRKDPLAEPHPSPGRSDSDDYDYYANHFAVFNR